MKVHSSKFTCYRAYKHLNSIIKDAILLWFSLKKAIFYFKLHLIYMHLLFKRNFILFKLQYWIHLIYLTYHYLILSMNCKYYAYQIMENLFKICDILIKKRTKQDCKSWCEIEMKRKKEFKRKFLNDKNTVDVLTLRHYSHVNHHVSKREHDFVINTLCLVL